MSTLVGIETLLATYQQTYASLLRSLEVSLAPYQHAYSSLLRSPSLELVRLAVRDWEMTCGSLLKAAQQHHQPTTLPPLKALPPPKTSHHEASANENLRRENEILRQRLQDASLYIEELGGTVQPTEWPPYEWPGDSLPWAESPH